MLWLPSGVVAPHAGTRIGASPAADATMRAAWHLRANALVLGWLIAAAVAAVAHRFLPASEWLMVHLLMLGGVTAAMLIWSAHFTQALRRRPLATGRRGEAVRLVGHTAGAVAVIVGIAAPSPAAVIGGAAVLGIIVTWHAAEVALATRGSFANRLGWTTWAYVAAAAAMVVGIVAGVALSRGPAGVDVGPRLYLAHVTLMILGWVTLTVVATLITLWPTVLAVRLPDRSVRWGRAGLLVLGAAVVMVVALIAADARVASGITVALAAAGIAMVAVPMRDAARMRPPSSVAAWHLAAAVAWLLGAALTWPAFVVTADGWAQAQERMGGVVAAVVAGGAAQVLLGALSHLMPMVLGGGPHAVRRSRGAVERRALARLVLINGGVALWVLPAPSLVRVGGSALALLGAVWTLVALIAAVRTSFRARQEPEAHHADVVTARPPVGRAPLPGKVGAFVAVGAVALTAVAGVAADPAAAGLGAGAAAEAEPTGHTVEVRVEAADMRFTPGDVELSAGDRLVLEVVNTDDTAHDLVLDTGDATGRLAPGDSARLDVGVVGRDIAGWCSIAGHRQMGMAFDIAVAGAAPVSVEGSGEEPEEQAPAGEGSAAGVMDLRADSDHEPYDASLAPAPDAAVHRVTLTVEDVIAEVAPGATQTLWTFNGRAPGPVLRGKVGDRFEITLVNDGDMGHSIDFHASQIAPDDVMRTIEPGESLTYTFVAQRAGAWLYHCSTAPMSMHIANGMAGAVIIDPPELEQVDREYVIVQSEMYLGAQAGVADATKIADEDADLVVFNGHATQYRQHPLPAHVGERVRVWVVDAGPSRATSFHVVGAQFDTVYAEGAYRLGGPGVEDAGGAQALALQPGQGGFVELAFPEPGHYPFVSHLMVDAERGAAGHFHVTDDPDHP